MFFPHTICRACGLGQKTVPEGIKSEHSNESLIPVFDLGIQPLANSFRAPHEEQDGYVPLRVLLCPRCHLGQLSATVDSRILYSRYAYETSKSQTMHRHFDTLVADFKAIKPLGTVVEIGSNDGLFLKHLKAAGAEHVLGIDPAKNLAHLANLSGVPTLAMLFDRASADAAKGALLNEAPDFVIARHCFAHIDDWFGFMEALKILGGPETLYYIEVPHAKKMLEMGEFDTVYSEHSSYLSVRAMQALLKRVGGLNIVGIKPYTIHGGCIGIFIGSERLENPSVSEWISDEHCALEDWQRFSENSHKRIKELGVLVRELVAGGKRVAAYGASAKCTVWMNACGFTRKEIQFVADTTPAKWRTMIPGTDIPVGDESLFRVGLPDYTLLTSWNFKDEILANKKWYTDQGGKFIIPTPEIYVVP